MYSFEFKPAPDLHLTVDGTPGKLRRINHYRNYAEALDQQMDRINCTYVFVLDMHTCLPHAVVVATKPIPAGNELFGDYGSDYYWSDCAAQAKMRRHSSVRGRRLSGWPTTVSAIYRLCIAPFTAITTEAHGAKCFWADACVHVCTDCGAARQGLCGDWQWQVKQRSVLLLLHATCS